MKTLILLGNETPLDLLFVNLLFKESLPPGEWCVGVEQASSFEQKKLPRYWKALTSSGPAFMLFNSLVHLPWGRTLAFTSRTRVSKIHELREKFPFELFHFSRINEESTLERIRAFAPDLIVNHMPQIMKDSRLFRAATQGVVNVHPGLLPDYQGLGSCLWPLIEDHGYHGTSLHFIDSEKIDAGPLVAVGRTAVRPGDSVFSLHLKARIIGAKLAAQVIRRVAAREALVAKPQENGRYRRLPDKKLLKAMHKKHKFIHWADRAALESMDSFHFEVKDATTNWDWRPA